MSAADQAQSGITQNASYTLPHTQDGEVDWNTLGSMLTAHALGEVVCAGYVDRMHRKENTEFDVQTDWKFEYKKHNIVVLRKLSAATCFMGRGVVDAPWRDVATLIRDVQSTYTWDNFIVEANCLRIISESENHTDYIGYQRHESRQCFLNFRRDMLYFIRSCYIDGKYVQSAISVEDPEYPPIAHVPRVEVLMGTGFVVEQYHRDESKTLISYLGNVDLKGLPLFIMVQVLKRHPLAIRYIRRQFRPLHSPSRSRPRQRKQRGIRQSNSSSLEESAGATNTWSRYEDTVPVQHFMAIHTLRSRQERRGSCERPWTQSTTLALPSSSEDDDDEFKTKPHSHSN